MNSILPGVYGMGEVREKGKGYEDKEGWGGEEEEMKKRR